MAHTNKKHGKTLGSDTVKYALKDREQFYPADNLVGSGIPKDLLNDSTTMVSSAYHEPIYSGDCNNPALSGQGINMGGVDHPVDVGTLTSDPGGMKELEVSVNKGHNNNSPLDFFPPLKVEDILMAALEPGSMPYENMQ